MKQPLFRRAETATLAALLTVSELAHAQTFPPVNPAPTSTETPAAAAPATAAGAATPAPQAAALVPVPAAAAALPATAATAPVAAAAPAPAAPAPAAPAPAAPAPGAPAPVLAAPAPAPVAAAPVAPPASARRASRRARARKPPPEKPLYPLYSLLTLHAVANSVWNNDVAYDSFNSKDVGGRFGVQLDADLVHLTPAIALAAELGYTYEATDNTALPQGLGEVGRLEAHHPHVAALLRWSLVDWLAVHARAQVGLSFTELQIERAGVSSGDEALTGKASSPFFALGAGLSVWTPAHRISARRQYFNSLAYGARIEAGYLFSSAVALEFPDSDANPPERQIAVRGADLGAVNRSGALLGLSAFVRF